MADSLTALTSTAACEPCQLAASPPGASTAPVAASLSPDLGARWTGVLGMEGEPTGDGRLIELNALVWDALPLPLRYVGPDVGAHDGAVVVGQIDSIGRGPGGQILGQGSFDLESQFGPEAMACVKKKTQNGISMDLDDVSFEVRVQADLLVNNADDPVLTAILDGGELPQNPDGTVTVATIGSGDEMMVTTSARVRAATLVAIPAFNSARITMASDPEGADDPMPEESDAGMLPDGQTPCSCDPEDPAFDADCDCGMDSAPAEKQKAPAPAKGKPKAPFPPKAAASAVSIVAGAAPETPPASWFSRPNFTEATALVVTAKGQVYGHLAAWGTCHISHTHSGCVTAPHSAADYAYFHTGMVLTAEGAEVPVGHITLDTRHAGEHLTAVNAAAHYENTGVVVADVAVGEDGFGIWVAGALRPAATAAQVRALRSAPLSGDWRRISGNLELVAALAVNVPGFPVPRPRGLVAAGVAQSLVASGMVPPRTVRRPGTPGALSLDDLRYLKRLVARERAEEQKARIAPLPAADALARRVRASSLAMRAHRPLPLTKEN